MQNKIWDMLRENPLIAELDVLHVPGYVTLPKASTVNDANWVAMGTAATDSADAVGYVALTAKKLIETIEITADIQAMSIPAFQGWLVNKLAQKMEAAICAAIVNGAGSSTVPQGVGQCGITTSTAIAGATLAKLSAFMGGLKAPYHSGAVWVMSAENFFTYILPLAQDSNGYLVQDGIGYRLLGHRVVLDDNCDNCKFKSGSTAEANNADHIIFGNFKEGYVFNFGEGIQVEADNSVSFRSGSTVYRAMALCDGAVAAKDAFVWTTIAAS
jgi:HK97 family phage major capsid protein